MRFLNRWRADSTCEDVKDDGGAGCAAEVLADALAWPLSPPSVEDVWLRLLPAPLP
jgi:hypothetical protein